MYGAFDATADDVALRRYACALTECARKVELTQPNAVGQLPIADGFAQMGIDFGTNSLQLPPSESSAMSRSGIHRVVDQAMNVPISAEISSTCSSNAKCPVSNK